MNNELAQRFLQLCQSKDIDFWLKQSFKPELISTITNAWLSGQIKIITETGIILNVKNEILRVLFILRDHSDVKAAQTARELINSFGFVSEAVEATPEPERCITFFQVGCAYEAYGCEAEFLSDMFQYPTIEFDTKGKSVILISFAEHLLKSIVFSLENRGYIVSVFSLKADDKLMY